MSRATSVPSQAISTIFAKSSESSDLAPICEFRNWDGVVPSLSGPVYVTVDLDALDPAFAPGISHHEPGGMSTRQLLGAIHQIGASGAAVVGADVVELNPTRDVNGVTAMVAAKIVRELFGLVIGGEGKGPVCGQTFP